MKSGFCDGFASFLPTFTGGRLSVVEGLLTVAEGLESVAEGLLFVAEGLLVAAEGFLVVAEGLLVVAEGLSGFLAVTVPFPAAEGLDTGPGDGLETEDPEVEPGAVLLTLVFPDAGLDDGEVRDSPLRVWASASA